MYDIEQYYNAKTVSEAVMLLKEHPDARIISGGSDVLIKIREGRMAGTSLVSIRDIEEIKGITGNENGDIHDWRRNSIFTYYSGSDHTEIYSGSGRSS